VLAQHVERVAGVAGGLDEALVHAPHHHGRLEQVMAVLGEQLARAGLAHLVAGPADALERPADRARRLDLDDQVDRAHVDAQLEAGRRHQPAQPAGLEVVLYLQPALAGERPVVGPHQLVALGRPGGALGLGRPVLAVAPQLVEPGGEALGQPPGVDEDERRPVGLDEREQGGMDGRPDRPPRRPRGRRPRRQLALDHLPEVAHVVDRHHDLDVELLADAGVDDGHRPGAAAVRRVVGATQEAGHHVERALGGGQPDALGRPLAQLGQPLERQRQVRAPLGGNQRVDLVDDDRLDLAQRLAGLGGEHEVERLGRGDEDVGRVAHQLAADVGRRVARAEADGGLAERLAQPLGRGPDAGDGGPQVAVDVDRQRPQGRDVDDARAGAPGPGAGHEAVDAPQEGGQGLARPGGGQDERVLAPGDGRPPLRLGGRGRGEARVEPGLDGRREPGSIHHPHPTEGV
jgi:hypothetical protein